MAKPKIVYEDIRAKKISYGSLRDRKKIRYIVIHHTGNKGDSARGNGLFFKNGNKRSAGAHYFVDTEGKIVRSIPMNRTAWSVGGFFTKEGAAGIYYLSCTNANSVSIEMCNYTKGYISAKQEAAVKQLIKYIQYYCPNASTIIRHWDVNGKSCPAPMASKGNNKWRKLLKAIKG